MAILQAADLMSLPTQRLQAMKVLRNPVATGVEREIHLARQGQRVVSVSPVQPSFWLPSPEMSCRAGTRWLKSNVRPVCK